MVGGVVVDDVEGVFGVLVGWVPVGTVMFGVRGCAVGTLGDRLDGGVVIIVGMVPG